MTANRNQVAAMFKGVIHQLSPDVFRALRLCNGVLPDTSKDFAPRGNGNAAARRAGCPREYSYYCSCDESPCQHEGIRERQSDRRDEHRTRRGVKTRR